jgi:hypothetical protein
MGRLAEGGLTAAAGPVLNAPAVAVFVVSSLAAICTTAVAVAAARGVMLPVALGALGDERDRVIGPLVAGELGLRVRAILILEGSVVSLRVTRRFKQAPV